MLKLQDRIVYRGGVSPLKDYLLFYMMSAAALLLGVIARGCCLSL